MENGLSSAMTKKLIMVALFLVAVVILVGGEDSPGVIGQIGDTDATLPGTEIDPGAAQEIYSEPVQSDSGQSNGSLSAWYAESDGSPAGPALPEPSAPVPVDQRYLISDAKPLVDATPIAPAAPAPTVDGEVEAIR